MFMLKSTHEKAMAEKTESLGRIQKKQIEKITEKLKILFKRSSEEEIRVIKRALDAERSITASLRAKIEELRPAADKWNAAAKKRRESRKVSK